MLFIVAEISPLMMLVLLIQFYSTIPSFLPTFITVWFGSATKKGMKDTKMDNLILKHIVLLHSGRIRCSHCSLWLALQSTAHPNNQHKDSIIPLVVLLIKVSLH